MTRDRDGHGGLQRLLWPLVIIVSGVAAIVAVLVALPAAIRVPATLWFVLLCPGMAYVRLLRLGDALVEIALAVALSLVLATLTALAMVALDLWHPVLALVLLVAIACIGVFLQTRSIRRDESEEAMTRS